MLNSSLIFVCIYINTFSLKSQVRIRYIYFYTRAFTLINQTHMHAYKFLQSCCENRDVNIVRILNISFNYKMCKGVC